MEQWTERRPRLMSHIFSYIIWPARCARVIFLEKERNLNALLETGYEEEGLLPGHASA